MKKKDFQSDFQKLWSKSLSLSELHEELKAMHPDLELRETKINYYDHPSYGDYLKSNQLFFTLYMLHVICFFNLLTAHFVFNKLFGILFLVYSILLYLLKAMGILKGTFVSLFLGILILISMFFVSYDKFRVSQIFIPPLVLSAITFFLYLYILFKIHLSRFFKKNDHV